MKFFLALLSLVALAIPGRSADAPITTIAEEYCAFLNSSPEAASSTDYYDSNYMCSTQIDGGPVPTTLILTHPQICIVRHNEYHFRYTIVPRREYNEVDIAKLSPRVRDSFLAWRKNPTVDDLCGDINEQLMDLYKIPYMGMLEVKEHYPHASKWIFNNIDPIVPAIHDGECYFQKEVRGAGHAYITFSYKYDLNNTDTYVSPALPLHAVVAPGMAYYRPSAVIVDDIPPASTPVVHVGKKSAYPIHDPGKVSVPIQEYVSHMNEVGADDYSLTLLACYYDKNLMDSASSEYCVIRSQVNGKYNYTIKVGCENFVIDGLTSWWAQSDFNNWTTRPTVQELVDYYNDRAEDWRLNQMTEEGYEPTVFVEDSIVMRASRYPNNLNANDMFNAIQNAWVLGSIDQKMTTLIAAIPGCEYSRPTAFSQFIKSITVVKTANQ